MKRLFLSLLGFWTINCFAALGNGPPGGIYISQVENAGSTVTRRGTLNFKGSGVSVADNNVSSRTDVTINGGGGGGSSTLAVSQNGVIVSSPTAVINFIGASVALTGGATAQVTITGGGSGTVNSGIKGQTAYYSVSGTTVSGTSNMITNTSSETFNVTTNHLFGLSASTGNFSGTVNANVILAPLLIQTGTSGNVTSLGGTSAIGESLAISQGVLAQFTDINARTSSPERAALVVGNSPSDSTQIQTAYFGLLTSSYTYPSKALAVIGTSAAGTINAGTGATDYFFLDVSTNSSTKGFLGLSVPSPQYNLDVSSYIHTNKGYVFSDGTIQTTAASGSGGATVSVPKNSVLVSTTGNTITGDTGFQYDSSVSSVTIGGAIQATDNSTIFRFDDSSLFGSPGSGHPAITLNDPNGPPSQTIKFIDSNVLSAYWNDVTSGYAIGVATGNGLIAITRIYMPRTGGAVQIFDPSSQAKIIFDPINSSTFSTPVYLSTLTISNIHSASSLATDSTGKIIAGSGGGGGSPGGVSGSMQYNNAGSFGGVAASTFTPSTNSLTFGTTTTFENAGSVGINNFSSFVVSGASMTLDNTSTFTVAGPMLDGTLSGGSATNVWTSNGPGLAPTWQVGGGGGGGGSGGYAVEPATVTFNLAKGFTASTGVFTGAALFSGPTNSTFTYGVTIGSITLLNQGNTRVVYMSGAQEATSSVFTFNGSTVQATNLSATALISGSTVNVRNQLVFGDGTIQTTAATGGGGGSSIYPASSTVSLPLGATISTAVFSGRITIKSDIVDNSLSAGTSGQILTSQGSGNPILWQTIPYLLLAGTQTVSGSNTFTSENLFNGRIRIKSDIVDNSLSAGTSGQFMMSEGSGNPVLWQTPPYLLLAGTQTVSGSNTFTSENLFNGRIRIKSDIVTASASAGTLGQVLTSSGSGNPVFWSTVSTGTGGGSGDMILASTQTSSGAKAWNSYSNFIGSSTFSGLVSISTLTVTSSATFKAVNVAGHIEISSTSATYPSLTSCGTSTVNGTDQGGQIVTGGTLSTSCTLNFATSWNHAPSCIAADSSANLGTLGITTSISQVVFTAPTASLISGTINYICIGWQ